jgi:hypothetical protein
MKFSYSILTAFFILASLQGGNARAEMRVAMVTSKSDYTIPKTPNTANDGAAIPVAISGEDSSSCAGYVQVLFAY